jgi:PAS domain S-box-containing protein
MFLLALGVPLMSLAALVRERERTDKAMRQSQRRYRLATTAGGVGVWDWNLNTDDLYVDPALKAVLGYEDHEIPNHVSAWARHVHPDDEARSRHEARLHLEDPAHPYEVEHRMLHKDGSIRWFLARGAVVERNDGHAVRMIGTDTDITERKRAEAALSESEELHRITLGNISDAVFLTDDRGGFTFICPNVDVIFGYGRDEVQAMDCIFHLLGDGLPDFDTLAAAGEMRNLEHDIITKTGERRTLLVHLKRVAIKGATVLYVCRDITERKRAEEELARSEARYRAIVEDQTELICRYRPDGTITFVNDAYCRYFGTIREVLVGQSFWHLILDAEHERCRRFIASITPDREVGGIEHRVVRPDGEIAWMQWTDRGLFAPDGTIVEIQSVGRDITERKRAEEEHRLLEAQRQVEEALREADRRKDEFLAMLGHELRNPLAPMFMALEVVRRSPPSDERAIWAQNLMARQVRQMTRLVDDLLDVSRITRGKIRLQMEPVDVRTVVAEAVETSTPLVQARGHQLTVSLPPEPARVHGDPVRLGQVVANLLNNAARYTEPGGRIGLTLTCDRREARLSVCDTGIGLAPEMLGRVFEPFVQAEGTRGGLGVGLTLVKRLVEMHGGTVEARSGGRGRGSEFVVRMPALAHEPPAFVGRPSPDGAAAAQVPLRILVVDDNVDAADTLARLLELWQHTVRVVHDGPEVLDATSAFAPDVVLLDLGLPTMDGLEVARRLRRTAAGASLLLVAMTGFGQTSDRRHTRAAGFDDHLVKPIDIETLRSLLACPRRSRLRPDTRSWRPVGAS